MKKVCLIKGKRITVELSASWMSDRKTILLGMRDITKNKLFEEQAKLAMMGEMIGNIAHQWRQPLSVITTIASGIEFREENHLLEGYNLGEGMDTIMNQANYLSRTIDDFRNFIKDNQEQSHLSLVKVLDKTISIVKPSLKNNNIELVDNFDDDLEIDGYENDLMQAFINIINNAKDAIREKIGEYDDRIIFITTKKSKDTLEISIQDNGGGIKEDVIGRIFEPYFTTKHQSIGTGIGLSMAHKILTEHHTGKITVENKHFNYGAKEYFGACFKILLN